MADRKYITGAERHDNPASGAMSTVYLMDCIEGMKRYPDKYFDLAIVDPPYGIGFDNKIRDKKIKSWDNEIPSDDYFVELKRVSKNQIIWGGNFFPYLWKNGCKSFIFWDKDPSVETYSDGELAWTSFNIPAKRFYWAWNGLANGIKGRNKDEKTIHPTQKPIALYEWIIRNYAQPNQKILDTHLGSGSSRIAAHKAGLDFVGFEIDREYYTSSNKRFTNYVAQGVLFSA